MQFSVHLHHMIRQAQGLGDGEEKIPSASKFFPYFLSWKMFVLKIVYNVLPLSEMLLKMLDAFLLKYHKLEAKNCYYLHIR